MNISDFNPLGGEKVTGNRNITDRQKTESREKTGAAASERTETRTQKPEEQRESTSTRDVFQTSDARRKVSELTDQVQRTEEAPRQDLVDQARTRASSGYYNSSDFLGNLALKLINTGQSR